MRWIDVSRQKLLEKPSPYGVIKSWIEQGNIHYKFEEGCSLYGIQPQFLMRLDLKRRDLFI